MHTIRATQWTIFRNEGADRTGFPNVSGRLSGVWVVTLYLFFALRVVTASKRTGEMESQPAGRRRELRGLLDGRGSEGDEKQLMCEQ